MNLIKTIESQDIEIFKKGVHNGFQATDEVLSQLENNTNLASVKNVIHHPDNPKYTLASFASLKRKGDKLFTRLTNVSKEFAESLKSGLFPNRSIHIKKNEKGWYIDHLGWLPLGVEAGVADMASVKFEDMKEFDYTIKNEIKFNEVPKMENEKKFEKENEALKEQVKSFEVKQTETEAETKVLNEKIEALEKTIADAKEASFSKIISDKTKNLDKKVEVSAELKELSKKFEKVEEFEKVIGYMKFDNKKEVPNGEQKFEEKQAEEPQKDLALKFEKLMNEPEKFEKAEKENSLEFQAMQKAFEKE